MAKCTDCLCYDACKTIFELAFKQPLPEQPFDKAENCKNFKDMRKFVEVVRCKDCEYRHDSCFAGNGNTYCDFHHKYFPLDGFCSYGERKDNG